MGLCTRVVALCTRAYGLRPRAVEACTRAVGGRMPWAGGCTHRAFVDALTRGKTARHRAHSVLRGTQRVLVEAGSDAAVHAIDGVFDQTRSAGEDPTRLSDQLVILRSVLELPAVAAAAAERGGAAVVTELDAATRALREARAADASPLGTPTETARLDLIDGIIVTLAREARAAGVPAIADKFQLKALRGPARNAEAPGHAAGHGVRSRLRPRVLEARGRGWGVPRSPARCNRPRGAAGSVPPGSVPPGSVPNRSAHNAGGGEWVESARDPASIPSARCAHARSRPDTDLERTRDLASLESALVASVVGARLRPIDMAKRRRAPVQQALVFSRRGGRRAGAGRKPRGARALVAHAARGALSGREPVLVTVKVRREIWNLRARRVVAAVIERIGLACDRNGMRIVHFSVQSDHVHLVVEAREKASLSRGVQGLSVRLARALNRMMKRRGKVFADRFHSRVLATPRQLRHALAYVLCNGRKHGHAPHRRWLDPCSSAPAFDGWSGAPPIDPVASRAVPVVAPRTWLMRVGWRRGGGPIWVDHDPDPRPDDVERWRRSRRLPSWVR